VCSIAVAVVAASACKAGAGRPLFDGATGATDVAGDIVVAVGMQVDAGLQGDGCNSDGLYRSNQAGVEVDEDSNVLPSKRTGQVIRDIDKGCHVAPHT
jgi:hypothetical protein